MTYDKATPVCVFDASQTGHLDRVVGRDFLTGISVDVVRAQEGGVVFKVVDQRPLIGALVRVPARRLV